jgi:hypothetical protein
MGGDAGLLYTGRGGGPPEPAELGALVLLGEFDDGDPEGLTDMRSMSSFRRSLSQSTRPPFCVDCFAASIAPSNWPPSLRRLFTKVSTFLCKLSTVSFISE